MAKENTEAAKLELIAVSYTHLRAHETCADLVCRLLLVEPERTGAERLARASLPLCFL